MKLKAKYTHIYTAYVIYIICDTYVYRV